jgi:hypothetical protein
LQLSFNFKYLLPLVLHTFRVISASSDLSCFQGHYLASFLSQFQEGCLPQELLLDVLGLAASFLAELFATQFDSLLPYCFFL